MSRVDSLEDLHPIAYAQFVRLAELLADDYASGRTRTLFHVFETYRPPEEQDREVMEGNSNAPKWTSAHQYGLAVDFVPREIDPGSGNPGAWVWEGDHDWDWLHNRARSLGLSAPITWDKVHIEHPAFGDLKVAWRKRFRSK